MAKTVPPVKLDNLIDILCNESYKEIGISVKSILADKDTGNLEVRIGESGAKDIINLGLMTGLLKGRVGNAFLTEDGLKLCKILKERGKGTEFFMHLHGCLQRIDVYKEYIAFLSEPMLEKKAKEFNGRNTTGKTIFWWLQTMGLIARNDKNITVQYIPVQGEREPTEEEFFNTIKEIYAEEAREAGPMWKGTFVGIRRLRYEACRRLKIDHSKFDDLLKELITFDIIKYSTKIRLAKGPAAAYSRTGDSAFEYKEEEYLYIALDEVQND